jgi:hypothetical protein
MLRKRLEGKQLGLGLRQEWPWTGMRVLAGDAERSQISGTMGRGCSRPDRMQAAPPPPAPGPCVDPTPQAAQLVLLSGFTASLRRSRLSRGYHDRRR